MSEMKVDPVKIKREAKMKKLAERCQSILREFGSRKDIIVTYDRPDKETICRYTEFQCECHRIVADNEYFLFWTEEPMHLLYVKNITDDSTLTAAAEMMRLAAEKF